ncbi:MAG: hypothetical protein P4L36_12985, partial [Holophaga sp.]|nr:hypothetical protein [Holophaga sp.]
MNSDNSIDRRMFLTGLVAAGTVAQAASAAQAAPSSPLREAKHIEKVADGGHIRRDVGAAHIR